VSSADFAFDQPLKGVPRTPGKTSASFALVRALNIPGPVGREGVQKLACWLAQRYEMRNAVLGSRGWYRPGRQVFRKLGPRHPCHFLAPLASQHQIDGRWP
jgi:hypothetical protein